MSVHFPPHCVSARRVHFDETHLVIVEIIWTLLRVLLCFISWWLITLWNPIYLSDLAWFYLGRANFCMVSQNGENISAAVRIGSFSFSGSVARWSPESLNGELQKADSHSDSKSACYIENTQYGRTQHQDQIQPYTGKHKLLISTWW